MELLAVIVALETLKFPGSEVDIYTDSKYVCDAVEKKWLFGWERTGFKKKKNVDLWQRFLLIYRKHNVRFHWVKGHADNVMNERCDRLAVEAYQQNNLLEDKGYLVDNNGERLW